MHINIYARIEELVTLKVRVEGSGLKVYAQGFG